MTCFMVETPIWLAASRWLEWLARVDGLSRGSQLFFHLGRRSQPGELPPPDVETGLLDLGPQRRHAVRDHRHPVVAGGGGQHRAVHADVGGHARDHQVTDVLAAEGKIKRRAVELIVGVTGHHQLSGPRRQFGDDLARVRALRSTLANQAVAGGPPNPAVQPGARRQVFRAERIAAQARDRSRVDELRVYDGNRRRHQCRGGGRSRSNAGCSARSLVPRAPPRRPPPPGSRAACRSPAGPSVPHGSGATRQCVPA